MCQWHAPIWDDQKYLHTLPHVVGGERGRGVLRKLFQVFRTLERDVIYYFSRWLEALEPPGPSLAIVTTAGRTKEAFWLKLAFLQFEGHLSLLLLLTAFLALNYYPTLTNFCATPNLVLLFLLSIVKVS